MLCVKDRSCSACLADKLCRREPRYVLECFAEVAAGFESDVTYYCFDSQVTVFVGVHETSAHNGDSTFTQKSAEAFAQVLIEYL